MSRKTIINYTADMDAHEAIVQNSLPDMPRHHLVEFVLKDWVNEDQALSNETLNSYLEQYVIGAYLKPFTARSLYRTGHDELDNHVFSIGTRLEYYLAFAHATSVLRPRNGYYNMSLIIALALHRYADCLEGEAEHA